MSEPVKSRTYRSHVREEQARRTRTAEEKIRIYAAAVTEVNARLAPVHLVWRDAAAHAPELTQMREEIAARRARNMRLFAQDLIGTGELRQGRNGGRAVSSR